MISKSDVGRMIKMDGERYTVLSFNVTPFSDLGCGPVIDITVVELQNRKTGEIVKLEYED